MIIKESKFLFLNQMAGPLFRELAEGLADSMPGVSVLKTGHQDTIKIGSSTDKLKVKASISYNRSNYLSRIFTWIMYTVSSIWAAIKADKDTALFLVSNPPLLGPAMWLVSFIKKNPYIVLVYDMHPDTLVNFGVLREESFITKLWRKVNGLVWSKAHAVYTIGPVMAERLEKQFDASKTKLGYVGVLPPWADTDKIKPLNKRDNPLAVELGQVQKTTVLYSGNMGLSHDIDSILEAAKILKDDKNISFLMIGEGAKWEDARAFKRKNALSNLLVLPFQPEEKLPFTMPIADISIVSLEPGAEGLMIPSKMFYYFAAGSAVIGVCSGRNDVSEIIRSGDCGVVIEPKNPVQLASQIRKLSLQIDQLDRYKRNSRFIAEEYYSRNACLASLKDSILGIRMNEESKDGTI